MEVCERRNESNHYVSKSETFVKRKRSPRDNPRRLSQVISLWHCDLVPVSWKKKDTQVTRIVVPGSLPKHFVVTVDPNRHRGDIEVETKVWGSLREGVSVLVVGPSSRRPGVCGWNSQDNWGGREGKVGTGTAPSTSIVKDSDTIESIGTNEKLGGYG